MRAEKGVKRRLERMVSDLRTKKTLAGVLNYGVVAFGPQKKDFLVRVTDASLFESPLFTVRYIALVDLFLGAGLALWGLGVPFGFPLFLLFFLLMILVFVNERALERHARVLHKQIKKLRDAGEEG